MARLVEDFFGSRPDDVLRRGGSWFVSVEVALEIIELATSRGVKVLGLEGFVVNDDAVYPSLSRIADFSTLSKEEASNRASSLLRGAWKESPTPDDQMYSEAKGQYVFDIALDG